MFPKNLDQLLTEKARAEMQLVQEQHNLTPSEKRRLYHESEQKSSGKDFPCRRFAFG